ncbi:MAG: hypothetical protein HGB15_06940 [Chlorobaculum sp.]|jgi:hypothetical protein|nr:hypothetical protein [Chlorobaculum sp.]
MELIEIHPDDVCIPPTVTSTLIKWSVQIKGVSHGRRYNWDNDRHRSRSAVIVSGNDARIPE